MPTDITPFSGVLALTMSPLMASYQAPWQQNRQNMPKTKQQKQHQTILHLMFDRGLVDSVIRGPSLPGISKSGLSRGSGKKEQTQTLQGSHMVKESAPKPNLTSHDSRVTFRGFSAQNSSKHPPVNGTNTCVNTTHITRFPRWRTS